MACGRSTVSDYCCEAIVRIYIVLGTNVMTAIWLRLSSL